MRQRISHISRPVQLIAAVGVLVLALGGTATASKLITGHDILNGSITGADIKAGSIARSDLSRTTVAALQGRNGAAGAMGTSGARGAAGADGMPGATGAAGTAGTAGSSAVVIFASVSSAGVRDPARFNNVSSVTHTLGTGLYTVHTSPLNGVARNLAACVAMVQTHGDAGSSGEAIPNADGTVAIATVGNNGNPVATDEAFVVTVSC
jgi:hypothetical protein